MGYAGRWAIFWLASGTLPACFGDVNPTGFSGGSLRAPRGQETSDLEAEAVGGAGGDLLTQQAPQSEESAIPPCSEEAEEIVIHLNLFRQQNGLGPIPSSRALCFVAERHLEDLRQNEPQSTEGCTENSWSEDAPGGACCYRADLSTPECMWEAPSRVVAYPGTGYESVAFHARNVVQAFRSFRDDPGHRALFLNQEEWAKTPWLAVGAAYVDGTATLWLGDARDAFSEDATD